MNEDYFSKKQTDCLKGFLAICVILHHLYQRTNIITNDYLGCIFSDMGYLSVAVFLFISGYGLMQSYKVSREEYSDTFLSARIIPFYSECIFTILIYIIFYALQGSFDIKKIALSFLFGDTIVPFGWYLQTIMIFYCLFFFVFRKNGGGDARKIVIMATLLLIYLLLCNVFKANLWWYRSTLAFPAGMVFAYKKNEFDEIVRKKYFRVIILCFSFLLFSFLYISTRKTYNVYIMCIAAVAFSFFVVCIMLNINITSLILQFLGTISFQIYILQGILVEGLRSNIVYIDNDYIYVVLSVLGTIALAYFMRPVYTKIYNKARCMANDC